MTPSDAELDARIAEHFRQGSEPAPTPDYVYAWTARSTELLREAAAAIASLRAERDKAIEIAMIRHCDVNKNGKTILDFHEVWLWQFKQRAEKAEAALAAANADAERWRRLVNLWLASTELSLTQNEDGGYTIKQIEPAEDIAFQPLIGDDPDAAIDAQGKGK